MQVGDLVRIRPNGIPEFRILEIVDDRALIQSPLDVPCAYPRQGGPQTASINHTAKRGFTGGQERKQVRPGH